MDYTAFENTAKALFPEITAEQLDRFRALDGLYRDWNSKINVISRKDIDSLYLHHVLHSLAIALYIREQMPELYKPLTAQPGPAPAATFLDLGTGGGFPGIPLAIMFPSAHFTLCDSIGKKILVAKEVAAACGLANTETVNARAETLPGQYDWIVSRAVTSLDKFMPWVKGRYRNGIFYLKGGDVVEEIALTMGRFNLPKGSVHIWKIDEAIEDPYFEGKLVIFIESIKNREK